VGKTCSTRLVKYIYQEKTIKFIAINGYSGHETTTLKLFNSWREPNL